jgi:UDP-N-acetylmuramate: L-alanyl-gamma-D-glutamyl-meso-diaminopimelate ligase
MHIHILGICGTFMAGLAALAKQAGHQVTGCDAQVYPPMSTQLENDGIGLIEGYSVAQLALKPDLFIIGNVISRGNPLLEAILNQGLPYTSGAQWLGEHILANKWVMAVAGTHGKTTTTAMLAWILEYAGMAPGFLIGGVPNNFPFSARLGQTDFFVIEADEYDTAFFDKRSKFVHYRPRTLILNNLEFDHADIFPDLAAIETQFHHLLRTVPAQGRILVNANAHSLSNVLARGCWSEVEHFAQGEWQLGKVMPDGFDVYYQQILQGTVTTALIGEHNRLNMLAAIAAARHVGVIPSVAIAALKTFNGVKRRMELVGEVAGIRVYDDFAHHPTAIATTLDGLQKTIAQDRHNMSSQYRQRILAVLEPRSNTMKLGVMKAQLPESLVDADLVFAYGASNGKDALGWDLAEALQPMGDKAYSFDDVDQLVSAIIQVAQAGDHIVIMSNGSFAGVHQKILDALQLQHA